MEQYKQEFIEFMVDSQVLKFGEFTLKSGRKSPFFMNAGAYVTGAQLKRLGEYYAKAIHDNYGDDFDVLFGPAYKGIPLSVATTIAYSELYGKEIRKSIEETFPILTSQAKVEIKGLMVSLNRMEKGLGGQVSALQEIKEKYGFDANAIVTMADVIEHLYNRPYKGQVYIDDTLKAAIDAYYAVYGA